MALAASTADAVLCLDSTFPLPAPHLLERLLHSQADAWHAGLRLGLEGQPRFFDHVNPLWMLNCIGDPEVETTSWRVSPRALLVRSSVLVDLDGPDAGMDTLSGAGLELGLRWIRSGALVRHVPDLAPPDAAPDKSPTDADGVRIIGRHHGRLWANWAIQRAMVTREIRVGQAAALARVARRVMSVPLELYQQTAPLSGDTSRTVSVIMPTIDRYAYLEPLLHQLAAQTVSPHEVIIADQTPVGQRRADLAAIAPTLPITVVGLPVPGQSTARNAALKVSTGEFALFIDDDDEIGPELIGDHLRRLMPGIDASCGGVDDAKAGPPPPGFRHRRTSDVFPTNNTVVRREALGRSGLFDLAYDRGPRADHDLGMRLHLGGALLVYDPAVMVFHHHAAVGGLRAHGARKVTRSSARGSLTVRHLPSVTETYLGLRYFTPHQNREAQAIRLLSLLSGDGSPGRRIGRAVIQVLLLPYSIKQMRETRRRAASLIADGPQIDHFDPVAPGLEGPE